MIGLQVQKFVSSCLSLPLWGSMHFFGSTEGKHLRLFFSDFFAIIIQELSLFTLEKLSSEVNFRTNIGEAKIT